MNEDYIKTLKNLKKLVDQEGACHTISCYDCLLHSEEYCLSEKYQDCGELFQVSAYKDAKKLLYSLTDEEIFEALI